MTTDGLNHHGELARWVRAATGHACTGWRSVEGGQTPSTRLLMALDDGSSIFVKAAPLHTWHGDALVREIALYESLRAPFLPGALASQVDLDAGSARLALPDLSGCHWPPPWRPGDVEAVRATLEDVARTSPPSHLPHVESDRDEIDGWKPLASSPERFLRLGIADVGWLDRCLPELLGASSRADLSGVELLHFDVRSDNLCRREDGTVQLIDWSWVTRGPADLDLLAWLPSLAAEGGPPPSAIAPNADPNKVALLAGMWAWQASLPEVPASPGLRTLQRRQLDHVLPWACDVLNLPGPSSAAGA